jgi:regulator of protease activity HflC (stomatin/prohibitin superfamily)
VLLFRDVTVYEWERGLLYRRGRFERVLEPGWHRIWKRRTWVRKLDTRDVTESVGGQEILTADGVTVRLSLAATYAIADPRATITASGDYRSSLYVALQLALRDVVAKLDFDDLVTGRSTVGGEILAATSEQARRLGLELKQVELKDLMLTGELRKTMAQVVAARKEGLAALEKARGETAALRNLANAARMMEGNPALMQLRLLQQLAGTSGNTVVLGFPSSTTPLPVTRPREPELPPAEPGEHA